MFKLQIVNWCGTNGTWSGKEGNVNRNLSVSVSYIRTALGNDGGREFIRLLCLTVQQQQPAVAAADPIC